MNGPAVHATVVALPQVDGWAGVMLRGPSGSGKSDLALRLIEGGARLVADDYVWVWVSGGRIYATAPDAIAGRIEVRGLGITTRPRRWIAPVVLIVDLTSEPVDRMQDFRHETIGGLDVPVLRLEPHRASATIVVAAALGAVGASADTLRRVG